MSGNKLLFIGIICISASICGCHSLRPDTGNKKSKPGLITRTSEDPVRLVHDQRRSQPAKKTVRVCSYNIQNLLDGINDPFAYR